ncbi:hypothetical protein BH10ACT7_BH10ACT7_29570 [soil metagenome]
MEFLFNHTPLWIALPVFVLSFLVLTWGVLLVVRPWVKRAARANEEWDRVLNYAMSSYGIFYGILLALIAVSVYENFQRVDVIVVDETSALAALYRAVSAYPDPYSLQLQDHLREYTYNVINVDWPIQRENVIPSEGNSGVDRLQALLLGFEPQTTGQTALHNQTLSVFFDFLEARRARLDETELALPPMLWVLLTVGAMLNALMLALVDVRNVRVHLIMSGIIAIFVAMLIFVTASMDHPYAGQVSITPEPFQNLLDQLMK